MLVKRSTGGISVRGYRADDPVMANHRCRPSRYSKAWTKQPVKDTLDVGNEFQPVLLIWRLVCNNARIGTTVDDAAS